MEDYSYTSFVSTRICCFITFANFLIVLGLFVVSYLDWLLSSNKKCGLIVVKVWLSFTAHAVKSNKMWIAFWECFTTVVEGNKMWVDIVVC